MPRPVRLPLVARAHTVRPPPLCVYERWTIEVCCACQAAGLERAGQLDAWLDGQIETSSCLNTPRPASAGECCDPDQYYSRVRPPIAGWRNNPLLPYGLVYEGVYGGAPVQLYGATGAQSSVVPAFDRVLDIRHEQVHAWAPGLLRSTVRQQ